MTPNGLLQIIIYMLALLTAAALLGPYMARVYAGKFSGLDPILRPIENFFYRVSGIDPNEEMSWKSYASAVLIFSLGGFLLAYALMRLQSALPLNPQGLPNVSTDLAFNTAISYITNTNWQAYAGEISMGYAVQMLVLTVQNFVSAATGMAVMVALIRGFVRHETMLLGNFWVDLVRSTLYILLPLAVILAGALVTQGVVQNFHAYQEVPLLQNLAPTHLNSTETANLTPLTDDLLQGKQLLPMGPAASQIAIKQLGTNGGGFFGTNSAHPFENPTPLSNFLEMLALLLIPAAFCFTFGNMVQDKRQGWAIFTAMTCIFLLFLSIAVHSEQDGNRLFNTLPIDQKPHFSLLEANPGGNMEGKEVRFGIVNSALWTASTTAASNGAVNSTLDSYTPLGGLVPIVLMQLGEIIYGGAGSGLYGMLVFVILTVFIAGLMVGRTPEYLGKKIEVFEMKMASLAILVPHFLILLFTAFAVTSQAGLASLGNQGMHGFSEILYTFTSTANNNGSSFAGLNANTPFYNISTGIAMLCSRFFIIVPILAIAGSLSRKKIVPNSQGTMPTHTPLFVGLLISVILIIGALTFFPSLALGPIVEHLVMLGH